MNRNKISEKSQNLDKKDIIENEIVKKSYQIIFENLNDLIFILNENLEFEFTNQDILFRLMNFRFQDLKGKSIFTYIHPESEEKVKKRVVSVNRILDI